MAALPSDAGGSVALTEQLQKNACVTTEAIEHFLRTNPFRPFQLVTASGESYRIPHPDFLTFSPSRRTCNVYADDGEYFRTLDVLTITDIQPDGKS